MPVENKLTKLQQAAVVVTGVILTLLLVTAVLVTVRLTSNPDIEPPKLVAEGDALVQDRKQKEIANYKALVEAVHLENTVKFDFPVTKVLIPIFTSLVSLVLTFILAQKVVELYQSHLAAKNLREKSPPVS